MSGCNIHNHVHFTGYTCIMNRYNSFGTFCNRFFNLGLIYIHGIRSDIYEHRLGSTKYESICRRYESKRRHNDFIAFFYICKQCCQLCCLCTGGSQKTFRRSCFFLDPFITFLRKRTISTDFLILYCLFYIFYFFPCIGRYVKINHSRLRSCAICLLRQNHIFFMLQTVVPILHTFYIFCNGNAN